MGVEMGRRRGRNGLKEAISWERGEERSCCEGDKEEGHGIIIHGTQKNLIIHCSAT